MGAAVTSSRSRSVQKIPVSGRPRQHAEVAVAVDPRWRHQCRTAVQQLQRRQDLRAVPARTLFGTLVEQVLGIELAQPVRRERWTAVDGPASCAYTTNYLIDVQAGIIVDVEATPGWWTDWGLDDMA